MNDADDSDDSYNSGTAQQVFEWRGGGGVGGAIFGSVIFVKLFFV